MANVANRDDLASSGNSSTTRNRRENGRKRTPSAARTLGPVPDLERHLPSDWWRTLFNAIYLQTDGDVVENEENTNSDVELIIRAAGVEPNDRILDLCCGQGRHVMGLARRGFRHVTGIDRSRYLIRLARRRAREAGIEASFHEGDARKFRVAPHSFHCVTVMGNSFGYFDREEDDVAVLEAVKRTLVSGGTLVMDLADGDWLAANFDRRSWEWVDQNHFVCRERSLAQDGVRLVSREVVVHAEKGVIADQFYAERLYSRERIEALLASAGFSEIRFHGRPETQSDRNQDLGMMAQRIFLTARAPRFAAATGRRERAIPYPEVAVLLGDPRLPDEVKLGGCFNAEDLDTVQKLKDALSELDSYRFRYLDNHASMLSELRADPPSFVLNLCDEGFNNDAFRELHIPAYLELLGIPYTGAGPAALGLCYDKALVRAVAVATDIPVPLETYAAADDQSATIPSIFPALIKPAQGDSSLGITKNAVVHNPAEAMAYLDWLRDTVPDRPVLIQEFLSGAEYSVGMVGNPGISLTALPVLEVDYSALPDGCARILNYESKWDPTSPYWTNIGYRETQIDEDVRRRLIDYSTVLFERLGCRDYARFDFRADAEGTVKLLEVNPNPGWCWDGKFNLMAGFAGIRYAELLRMILDAGQARAAASETAAVRAA